MAGEKDYELRLVAIAEVRDLARRHGDIIPLDALRAGFTFNGLRIPFASFYNGIFRPKEMTGPAALSLTTAPPKARLAPLYGDGYEEATDSMVYHYRSPQRATRSADRAAEADNRALRAAAELQVPVIYFLGIAAGQYSPVAPVFVINDDPVGRRVSLQASVLIGDARVAASGPDVALPDADRRRYATREAVVRLHQHRFREIVLRAYNGRCAVCALRESDLLQAAHILEDRDPEGVAAVINGIALCAIHHLAYDRNLMGIDPAGGVHVSERLLREVDGPMLRSGLQSFHGAAILQPRRLEERPDPTRLEVRFNRFQEAA